MLLTSEYAELGQEKAYQLILAINLTEIFSYLVMTTEKSKLICQTQISNCSNSLCRQKLSKVPLSII